MFTADDFRAKAAESAQKAKETVVPSEIREFQPANRTDLVNKERRMVPAIMGTRTSRLV
jgi:hypothetical protein